MKDRIKFFLNRISERLWVRPLIMCVLSIIGALVAKMADFTEIGQFVPDIKPDSIETLLTVISASMLVIATFSVSSMVSAYASASGSATPRSFSLVISDDVSQNALSAFIGAFIFSIVALIASQNSFYEKAGRFVLFVLTLVVFAIVIVTFVRWVDSIARLGRLGTTINKVEDAAAAALARRRSAPTLGGVALGAPKADAQAIYGHSIGYVQRVDVAALQAFAEKAQVRLTVAALPGLFVAPGRAVAYVTADTGDLTDIDTQQIGDAFLIGGDRIFDEDPRFGMIVLSEIASRALSPAINDPGTAIDIIGTFVRLFALWSEPVAEDERQPADFDRIAVPEISMHDLFDDAFGAMARDGAGTLEVGVRLQKAFRSLAWMENGKMREVAQHHSRLALARAAHALELPEDVEVLRQLAALVR